MALQKAQEGRAVPETAMVIAARQVLADFERGECRVDWMRERLWLGARRLIDAMPPRGVDVLAWVSDPRVSIWFCPIVVRWRGKDEWWTGLSGHYFALRHDDWVITHWAYLPSNRGEWR